MALKRNGTSVLAIYLSLTLAGPEPWLATGRATFQFIVKAEIPIFTEAELKAMAKAVKASEQQTLSAWLRQIAHEAASRGTGNVPNS